MGSGAWHVKLRASAMPLLLLLLLLGLPVVHCCAAAAVPCRLQGPGGPGKPRILPALQLVPAPSCCCYMLPCRLQGSGGPAKPMHVHFLTKQLPTPACYLLCPADCKDLDASCEPWANSGECEKNVEYMIGAANGCCLRFPSASMTRKGWVRV